MANTAHITAAPEIQLTSKGWAYCDQEKRKEIVARINEHLKLASVHQDAAQAYIALMDHFAPDPDLEPNGDDEPSLGWPANGPSAVVTADNPYFEVGDPHDDREVENADWEDNGDDEPLADDEPDHHSVPEYPEDPRKPQYVQSIQDGSYLTEMRDEREVSRD